MPEETVDRIFEQAKADPDAFVRGRCWQALAGEWDRGEIRQAIQARLNDEGAAVEERGGALVAVAENEGDDPKVQQRMVEFYERPEARFRALQTQFSRSFSALFDDPNLPRTVLIVPSLTLDQEVLARISGVHHYEERSLCLLLLLRMPRTRVIYVTSTPVSETIIDYYLHLLPGVPGLHARRRLTLVSCDDASPMPLARKILERPRVLERIRQAIPERASAHMTCFTVSDLERRLALKLNLPIYGCDPSLLHWGSKSGSRKIFRETGVDLPYGFEDLADADDVGRALAELKTAKPALRKAVVKLNEGFSGEGNAIFDLSEAPAGAALLPWVRERLPSLSFEARGMTFELYQSKLAAMGGIVEEFIPGAVKQSPSAQFRITPVGAIEAVSTHDQVLGGANGQDRGLANRGKVRGQLVPGAFQPLHRHSTLSAASARRGTTG